MKNENKESFNVAAVLHVETLKNGAKSSSS